jgi:hypothetical protein
MKLLTYQARHFAWQTFSQTLPDADPGPIEAAVDDAVVAWLHVEAGDVEQEARVFRHVLKHIKWIANKRGMRTVALHSFAHLGGTNAPSDFARAFIQRLGERLRQTGYTVAITPFGWFCSWQLDVYGDSLAKVFKQID